jgi:CheY-like chemotaxis protein
VRREELRKAITGLLANQQRRHGEDSVDAVPSPASPRRAAARSISRTILLTDDNVVNQRVALRILEREGHNVVIAGNGKEALAALDQQRFDVVLMDAQMPEMDGLETTAAIRQRERGTGKRTPIIAMTAHAMTGDRERCLAAGMDGYISKPVDARELLKLVESIANGSVQSS